MTSAFVKRTAVFCLPSALWFGCVAWLGCTPAVQPPAAVTDPRRSDPGVTPAGSLEADHVVLAAAIADSRRADQKRADGEPPSRTPLFQDWPKPDAMILFTGQQHGYTKPCGCDPEAQKGGLARRHSFIETVRKRNWPLALVDLGGLAEDHSEQPAKGKFLVTPQQSQEKLKISIEAIAQIGYDVLNLAPEDLAAENGVFGLAGLLLNMQKPRGLSSNLNMPDDFVKDGLFLPHIVLQLGGLKVGIAGMIGETFKNRVDDPLLQWQDPEQQLPATLKQLKAQADVKILLLYAYLDEAKQIAEKFPDFDVIIHASQVEEPTGRPERVGKTMLVTVGTKGKYAGAVGIFRSREPDGETPTRFELIDLDERFPEHEATRRLVYEDYLERLARLNLVEQYPRVPVDPNQPGLAYVGSEACKECHPNVYQKWKSTDHATAMQSLIDGRRKGRDIGLGKGSQVDPECVSCHSVGFLYQTGFDGTPNTQHLGNNGCENCHSPGSKHVEIMKNENRTEAEETAALKLVHAPKPTAERSLCTRCHDGENDPGFRANFRDRWKEIVHNKEAEKDRENR